MAQTLEEVLALESKDALSAYCQEQFGQKLDTRKKWENLEQDARDLESGRMIEKPVRTSPKMMGQEKSEPDAIAWLLNPATGNKFISTPMLIARGDLVPCDPPEDP